jgi:glutamyl-tRNA reductase
VAQLVIIGTHQRICPVSVRERLAFNETNLESGLRSLRSYADEGFIISTCNRVEIGGIVADDTHTLIHFLADYHQIDQQELAGHLYTFTGAEAVRHLFRLAAGLDSMVLGEDQIQVQLKNALHSARSANASGQLVERLLQNALAAGKLVRTATGISRHQLSVVSVALSIARTQLNGLNGRRVLVVGAGRMAELALKHLHDEPNIKLTITNRSFERAQNLATTYRATALPFEQLGQALAENDLVVSCTSASTTVISAEMLREAGPTLLLDLAVPRDIEAEAAELPNVQLYDVDALQPIAEANRQARTAEISHAELLVEAEVTKFMEWWETQKVVPTIRALHQHAEAIRTNELQRTLSRLSHLSPREQEAISALSTAIVNKLLHQPIATLKNPQTGNHLVQALHQLFQLDEESRSVNLNR